MRTLPCLNPVCIYFLSRYKARLLEMPFTREVSILVDCIDLLLEAGRGYDHA